MILATAVATTLIAGSAAAQNGPAERLPAIKAKTDRCAPTADIVDYRRGTAIPRKLGEMPPASQIYTVYNEVDGCPQPVVLRNGIGGNHRAPVSPTRSPPRASKVN